MKTVYLILSSLGLCFSLQAQSVIKLRMNFNTEQNRYEVYARPDFSAKNFTWGPSQVSVVLPASQQPDRLSIRSTEAGSWADNSVVVKPRSSPDALFHGITSAGGKLDLVAGQDYLLFDFTLPAGYVDQVRLFDNTKDPNSAQPGMQGGDFTSYIADAKRANYLVTDSRPAPLTVKQEPTLRKTGETQAVELVAYPNPATGGTFRLYMKGFDPAETVTLRMRSLTGLDYKRLTDKVANLMGKLISIPDTSIPCWLLSVERPATSETFTQKIWLKD